MPSVDKILSFKEAVKKVAEWRANGDKTVFSNGCFDIIHAGHVDYLEKARQKGDRLIVGLNTDYSVSRIKGKNRPIVDEVSRSRVLAALEFVDAVAMFNEDTPYELIKALNPDVLVKGKDYDVSNIVGADFVLQNGGKVETIELTERLSTTILINKIKNL
ncbi:MAG: D-glycero-beta-D-manno-heptose 1-phosphate adenylyltransferase [Cyclobacteriaceae bacterium]|nr:D-glycero-beta-D-manno-heptose 1-phosphate adenylyltransferase [Cyclobacteriaceae bacterium]MCK5277170.1 D-glycero-beta-D-manno-heptose 1-phosphate adenylyltransferase [Cyclobacteriaceae bacterium]MCK5470376.1 D-glycero-beta-D-manno-heptose 1-phosphate adenylyltransferase [Cyclobacteriaceae bacterium]